LKRIKGRPAHPALLTTPCVNRIAAEVPAYDGNEIFFGAARFLLERFERMPGMAAFRIGICASWATDRVHLHEEGRVI
jgi:hypothetical protein